MNDPAGARLAVFTPRNTDLVAAKTAPDHRAATPPRGGRVRPARLTPEAAGSLDPSNG